MAGSLIAIWSWLGDTKLSTPCDGPSSQNSMLLARHVVSFWALKHLLVIFVFPLNVDPFSHFGVKPRHIKSWTCAWGANYTIVACTTAMWMKITSEPSKDCAGECIDECWSYACWAVGVCVYKRLRKALALGKRNTIDSLRGKSIGFVQCCPYCRPYMWHLNAKGKVIYEWPVWGRSGLNDQNNLVICECHG